MLFSRSHRHFETQILREKSLCAHYILNQWLEFYQTSTDTSLGHRKEVIRFWWPWPHFQGHYIIKTLKMSLVCTLSRFQGHYIIKTKNEPCMHSISWINRWNLTKLAQLHHWDGGMKWSDFGDLDLIFKVTPALWNSNLIEKSLCANYLLNQWLEFYQTSTDTSLGQGKELIRFWWPWPHFQGHYIIKTLKNELCVHLMNQ